MTQSGPPGALLITGASRGIGAAVALQAAAAGWDVAINCLQNNEAANAVAARVRALGQRACVVSADVADEAQVAEMFEQVDATLGPLRGLVNSAGIVAPAARLEDIDGARITRLLAVNVAGTMLCSREAVRRMATGLGGVHDAIFRPQGGRRGGVIVNLSSAAARLGSPGEYIDYAASKGAVDTFTLGLAREVAAQGVRVNAVRPGLIDTEIHASGGQPDRAHRLAATVPMQRPGTADEVAAAVLWLLGDKAAYTTGAIVDVSGGR